MLAFEVADREFSDACRRGAAVELRKATPDDVPQLIRLRRLAIRELAGSAYSSEQIDGFLLHAPALDDELVGDGTYFVAVAGDVIVGAGGWCSGARAYPIEVCHVPSRARPGASIRAMYTHPEWVRRGVGSAILVAVEADARAAGFGRVELHTLTSSVPFYGACGYTAIGRCRARFDDGVTLPLVHMAKHIGLRHAGVRDHRRRKPAGPPWSAPSDTHRSCSSSRGG